MFSKETLINLLNELTGAQESIEKVSVWLQQYKDEAINIIPAWRDVYMQSSKEKKLTLLYLVNDVVQHSKRKGPHFVEAFSTVLPKCMAECKHHESKSQIERMLDIWESREIFGKHVVSAMKYNLDEFGMEESYVKLSELMSTLDDLRSLETKSSDVLTKLSIRLDTTDFANAFNVTSRKEGDKYAGDFDETANFLEQYCSCLSNQTSKRSTMLRKINSTLYQMEKLEESVKNVDKETKNKQAQLVRTRKAITSRLMMIDEGMINFGDDSPNREEIENLTSEEEDVDIEGIETIETNKNGKDDKIDKVRNGDVTNTTFEDDGIRPEDAIDEQKPQPKVASRPKRQMKKLPSYDPRQILSYGFRLDGPPDDEQAVGFMLLPDGTLCAVPIAPHMFLQKPKPPSPKEEGEIENVEEIEIEGPKTPEESISEVKLEEVEQEETTGPKTPSEDLEFEEGEVSASESEKEAEPAINENEDRPIYDEEVDGVPFEDHFDITKDGYASSEDHASSPGSAPSMPSPEVSDEEDPQVTAMRNVSTWQENYNMPEEIDGESLKGDDVEMDPPSDPEEGELSEDDEPKTGMTGVAAFLSTFSDEETKTEEPSEYEQFYPPGYLKEVKEQHNSTITTSQVTNMKPAYLMGSNFPTTNRQLSAERNIEQFIDHPRRDHLENTPPPKNKPLYLSGQKTPYNGPPVDMPPHQNCPPYNGLARRFSDSSDNGNHYKEPPDEYDHPRYPSYPLSRPRTDYGPSPIQHHPRRPLPPQEYYQHPRPYLRSPPPRQSYPPPRPTHRGTPPPRQAYPPPGVIHPYSQRPQYIEKKHPYERGDFPVASRQRYPSPNQDHFLELSPRSKQPEIVGSGGMICRYVVTFCCVVYYACLVSCITFFLKVLLKCNHLRRKSITWLNDENKYTKNKYHYNPLHDLKLGDTLSISMKTEITVYMINGQNVYRPRPPFQQHPQQEHQLLVRQRPPAPFGNQLPNYSSQPPPFTNTPVFNNQSQFGSFPPPMSNEYLSRSILQTTRNESPQILSQVTTNQAPKFSNQRPQFSNINTQSKHSKIADRTSRKVPDGRPPKSNLDPQQSFQYPSSPKLQIQKYGPPIPTQYTNDDSDIEDQIPTQSYRIQKYGPAIPRSRKSRFGPPLPQTQEQNNIAPESESSDMSSRESEDSNIYQLDADNNFQSDADSSIQSDDDNNLQSDGDNNFQPAVQKYNTNFISIPQRPVVQSDHEDDMSESSDDSLVEDREKDIVEEPFGDIPKPKVDFYKKEEKVKPFSDIPPPRISLPTLKPNLDDVKNFSPFDDMLFKRQEKFKPLRSTPSIKETVKFSSFPGDITNDSIPISSASNHLEANQKKDTTSIDRILELYDLDPSKSASSDDDTNFKGPTILQDVFGGETRSVPRYYSKHPITPPVRQIKRSHSDTKSTTINNNNQQGQGGKKKRKRKKGSKKNLANDNNQNTDGNIQSANNSNNDSIKKAGKGIFEQIRAKAKNDRANQPEISVNSDTSILMANMASVTKTCFSTSTSLTPTPSSVTTSESMTNSITSEKERQRQEVLQKIALLKEQNEKEKKQIKAHMQNWKEAKVQKDHNITAEMEEHLNKVRSDLALGVYNKKRGIEAMTKNMVSTTTTPMLPKSKPKVSLPSIPTFTTGSVAGHTLSSLPPFFQQVVAGNTQVPTGQIVSQQSYQAYPPSEVTSEPAPPGFGDCFPPQHFNMNMRMQRPSRVRAPNPGSVHSRIGIPPGMPMAGLRPRPMHSMPRNFTPRFRSNFNRPTAPPVKQYHSAPSFNASSSSKNQTPIISKTISVNPPTKTASTISQPPKIDVDKMKKALELKAKIDQKCVEFKKPKKSRFDLTPQDVEEMKAKTEDKIPGAAEEKPTSTESINKLPDPSIDLDDIENLVDHSAGDLCDFEF